MNYDINNKIDSTNIHYRTTIEETIEKNTNTVISGNMSWLVFWTFGSLTLLMSGHSRHTGLDKLWSSQS